MPIPPLHGGSSRSAVLSLTAHEAEWMEHAPDGEARYGRVTVQGPAPGDLATAAAAARRAAGGEQRSCVLMLGDGLVRHGMLKLPPLGRKDLERVIARKAVAESEFSPSDTFYSGLKTWSRTGESCHWTVATTERNRLLETLLRLRNHGFRVRRVSSISTAILNRAWALTRDSDTASIVVAVGPRSVEASLIAGGELVSAEVLGGDFLEAAHLVASLMQSVRTLAAFWRRSMRGQEVGDICVFGLPSDRGGLLAQTLGSALPEATVHVEPGADAREEDAGRIALLLGCLEDGPLAIDLTPELPWRNSTLFAAAALILAVAFGSFWFTRRTLEDRRSKLDSDTSRLEMCAPDLFALQRQSQRAGQGLADLYRELGRARDVWDEGVDYEGALLALATVLEGRATLMAVTLERGSKGGRNLVVSGLTTGDPVRSAVTVGEIEKELSRMAGFREVQIDLPSWVGSERENAPLAFTLHAYLEASS